MTTEETISAADSHSGELRFEQTVPCGLAHRRALGEVFVADTAAAGPDEYLAAIQLPRAHSLWFDRVARFHDPLSVVEAVRQALIVIGHRYLRVPPNTPVSLQRLAICVEDLSAFRDNERTPLEGIVRARADGASASRGYFTDTSFDTTVTVGGALAMTLTGGGIAFPAEAYDELRSYRRSLQSAEFGLPTGSTPLDPVLVGRRDPRNVVLGTAVALPEQAGWQFPVIANPAHPSFFDHEYDHVPGPLLIEAFRQAAIFAAVAAGSLAAEAAAIVGIEAEFTDFAELDARLDCTVVAGAAEADLGEYFADLALHQFGEQIGRARIELAPYPHAPSLYV
ncbi:AfsA-related hotdog domain-containing protein [Nocardia goodfellowii]|uniref:A-factor biosynthesis hotdog domain-containing protein n=1 Tax=Nocardia goodfellowii TaxID=882446 RepID=A0ABS4Q8I8_9NOCA|nr:AfsA-related hotdog domain-containing protein [Nocardia goodfellowii]MBP2187903.1 hypothetical protein [Nocardia goodfellowii]